MEKIRTFILHYIEKKGNIPDNIDIDEFDFVKTGLIDSLAVFKFILVIEQHFDIEIFDEDLSDQGLTTVGGLARLIQRKVESK